MNISNIYWKVVPAGYLSETLEGDDGDNDMKVII